MDKVTLAACPPGLFRFNGTLCFKSEYVTTLENPRRYQCDAYVVESGEYFHGGAPNTLARSNLLVEPLATPAPDSEKLREALTPSGDTKAAYSGEFKFDVMFPSLDEDDDEPVPHPITVPWDTIKEIMAAIASRAGATS